MIRWRAHANTPGSMLEDKFGQWVRFDDADEVRRERDLLREEVHRWRTETKAPPMPIIGCDCYACEVLRRHQRELCQEIDRA